MLKLFSSAEKPTSSHTRSKTQPNIQQPSGNISSFSAPTAIVNGQKFSFIEPTSAQPTAKTQHEPQLSAPLTEPTKAHQRNLTEQVRSTKDLPPLIIKAAESGIDRVPQLVEIPLLPPYQQLSQLQCSPDPSRQSSPTRSGHTSLGTDCREKAGRSGDRAGKLASWFKGESEPITIGLLPSPTKEKADPHDSMGSTSEVRPTALLQRTSTTTTFSKPAMASRFSFFTSKASSAKPAAPPFELDDDLMDMDINTALLPAGSPDPVSPAAFKSLQQQAERLLVRLQNAYKERTIALRDMAAEKEALVEEAEGAETKARHLKTQLDDLSAKLAEQDEAMMNLVDELAQEKLARQEEEEARKRSVRLVQHATPTNTSQRRRALSNPVSDSGFESEEDSSAESVFSRRDGAHSPAFSMSSVSTNNSPEAYHAADHESPMSMAQNARLRSPPNNGRKGTSTIYQNDATGARSHLPCTNCSGTQAAEAWNVVSILKEENKCFKQRVGELEGALGGCLDLVNTLS